MGKKKILSKINKAASDESYENLALLENLISNAEGCPASCCILLEMVKKKTENIFKKIEKNREILNLID